MHVAHCEPFIPVSDRLWRQHKVWTALPALKALCHQGMTIRPSSRYTWVHDMQGLPSRLLLDEMAAAKDVDTALASALKVLESILGHLYVDVQFSGSSLSKHVISVTLSIHIEPMLGWLRRTSYSGTRLDHVIAHCFVHLAACIKRST